MEKIVQIQAQIILLALVMHQHLFNERLKTLVLPPPRYTPSNFLNEINHAKIMFSQLVNLLGIMEILQKKASLKEKVSVYLIKFTQINIMEYQKKKSVVLKLL